MICFALRSSINRAPAPAPACNSKAKCFFLGLGTHPNRRSSFLISNVRVYEWADRMAKGEKFLYFALRAYSLVM